jgi:hypothetical protein
MRDEKSDVPTKQHAYHFICFEEDGEARRQSSYEELNRGGITSQQQYHSS